MKDEDAESLVELSTLTESGAVKEPTPVVFIEGTPASIFRGLDDFLNEEAPPGTQPRRLLVIKCGAYSSLWDRAHEIYYALKGGRCDYGERHSKKHNHARYGTTHAAGLYENWSEAYPLHFVGHSFGGATIFHLQQLLGRALPGTPGMMKSVVTISSPLRGTPLASSFGQLDGPEAGQKRFSPGWVLASLVHVGARTANVVGKDFYDFGNDHWLKPATDDDDHADEKAEAAAARSKFGVVDSFCDYLAGRSVGFSPDSACYDMLLTTMEGHNANSELCPKTFYRSYTASTAAPLHLPPLALCHYLLSSHRYGAGEGTEEETEWRENDGLIPVRSQMHPKDCHDTICLHIPPTIAVSDEPPPLPGAWHVRHYPDTTHFGLVDYLWQLHTSAKTRLFWRALGGWLRVVDETAAGDRDRDRDGGEEEAGEHVKDSAVSIVEA